MGILHSGGGLGQTIDEWASQGVSPVVLDAEGGGYSEVPSTTDLGFVISDDKPLTEDDRSALRGAISLSLGRRWLQGHSCIAILHHLLDGR